jgi:hypothetical protein
MTLGRLWAGALLSPLAWAADLGGKLFLSRTVVATERKLPLFLLTALALLVALSAAALSRQQQRAASQALTGSTDSQRDTLAAARSVATWGVGLGLFFALLIAAMAVPSLVFAPRDLP